MIGLSLAILRGAFELFASSVMYDWARKAYDKYNHIKAKKKTKAKHKHK